MNLKDKKGLLVVLSGPEPQRSILEERILEDLHSISADAVVICGKTDDKKSVRFSGDIKILSYATTSEISEYIQKSELIFVIVTSNLVCLNLNCSSRNLLLMGSIKASWQTLRLFNSIAVCVSQNVRPSTMKTSTLILKILTNLML